jgi:catechol 2,3-dioxygenase
VPSDSSDGLPASTRLGRVALRVGSLDRTLPFYRDVVGLEVDRGADARATLSAAGRPLVVLLEAPDAPERPRAAAGLFHLAVRVPDRGALGDALGRIRERGSLTGASDHLVSEALYLRDPEGNGVEVYADRPREEWPETGDGRVEMESLPLDVGAVAAAAAGEDALPVGTDLGHVHLEVTDLARSTAFYAAGVGLDVRDDSYDGARFLAAGDYHHHVGLNTWNARTDPAGDHRGLAWWELVLPDRTSRRRLADRLADRGTPATEAADGFAVADPDGIDLRVLVE